MISLDDVERIHKILIEKFGGKEGLRDRGLLESSIKRPFQTFDQKELYPDPVDKAAAILESIISNHPFLDGNKRTAYVLARLLLRQNNLTSRPLRKRNITLSLVLQGVKFGSTR